MPDCGRCGGDGYTYQEEDGRSFREACYHCGTSGKIDEETLFEDDFAAVVEHLAYIRVSAWQKDINNSPDGEDLSFIAAENMCSVQEIIEGKFYSFKEDIAKELEGLSRGLKEDLITMYERFTKPVKPVQTPAPAKVEEVTETETYQCMPGAKISVEEIQPNESSTTSVPVVPYDPDDDIPF